MGISQYDANAGADIMEMSPVKNAGAFGVVPGLTYMATPGALPGYWHPGTGPGWAMPEPAAPDGSYRSLTMRPERVLPALPGGVNFMEITLPIMNPAEGLWYFEMASDHTAGNKATARANPQTGAMIGWAQGGTGTLLFYRATPLYGAFRYTLAWPVEAGKLPRATVSRQLPAGGVPTTTAQWWFGSPHLSQRPSFPMPTVPAPSEPEAPPEPPPEPPPEEPTP